MASSAWLRPVTLSGRRVRLEPLARRHLDGLVEVGLAPAIWRWMPINVATGADMAALVEAALAAAAAGREMPFATVELASGRIVGSTRYLNIEPGHRRLEIGWTWLAPAWQRTGVNAEAKLLMLGHAFDELGALRVEFKTDARNERSRRALAAIGAVEEGTLRGHMLTPAGRRDSVYFSVLAEEWPAVRAGLEARFTSS
ncbi:MAG TPA: GNAT family protein [Candidatus Limnocylindria bacterium]|nr:GNAT family protein [Candidatus Limnocylindria bacterium]